MSKKIEYSMDQDMAKTMIQDIRDIMACQAHQVNGVDVYTVKALDLVVIKHLLRDYSTLLAERKAIMDIIGK